MAARDHPTDAPPEVGTSRLFFLDSHLGSSSGRSVPFAIASAAAYLLSSSRAALAPPSGAGAVVYLFQMPISSSYRPDRFLIRAWVQCLHVTAWPTAMATVIAVGELFHVTGYPVIRAARSVEYHQRPEPDSPSPVSVGEPATVQSAYSTGRAIHLSASVRAEAYARATLS